MALTTNVDIRNALISPIEDNAFFGIDFAFENYEFEPNNKVPYGQAFIIRNQPTQAALGDNGLDEHDGVLQIILRYPQEQLDGPALTKTDEIAQIYKSGVKFTSNSQEVTIRSIGATTGVQEGGFFRLDLNIEWFAFVQRS